MCTVLSWTTILFNGSNINMVTKLSLQFHHVNYIIAIRGKIQVGPTRNIALFH